MKLRFDIPKLSIFLLVFFIIIGFIIRHKAVFVFLFLLFLASISRTYNHFFWLPQLGFELYSASTILTGIILGPGYGFLQGMLSNFFAYFFSGKFKIHSTLISMFAWGMIGMICGIMAPLNPNITILGMVLICAYDLISFPIFVATGTRISSALFHLFTHILLSLFLFRTLVPILYIILR